MTSRLTHILSIALALLLLVGAAPMGASAPLPPNPGGNLSSATPGSAPTPPDVGGRGGPSITLRVQTPAYTLDAAGLAVPGDSRNDIPGAPNLPVWATIVELPAEGGWTISYDAAEAITLTMPAPLPSVPVPDYTSLRGSSLGPKQSPTSQEIASSHRDAPQSQNPLLAMTASDAPDFVPTVDRPDPAIYAADAFYPASPVQEGRVAWQGGRRLLALRVFPFQYNPVAGTLRYYPDIRVTVAISDHEDAKLREEHEARSGDDEPSRFVPFAALRGFAIQTSPAAALRLRTGARGLYRLTWADLVTAGVPVTTTAPATFAVSYLGQPVDIQVTGEDDSHFDPGDLVIFYAEPYVGRYMTQNVYWFTWGGADAARMATRTAPQDAALPVTVITQTLHVERDIDYYSAFTDRPQEADHWFDKSLVVGASDTTSKTITYTLALVNPLTTDEAVLRAVVHGGLPIDSTPDLQAVQVKLNDHLVGVYQWDGGIDYRIATVVPAAWLDRSPNVIELLASRWLRPDSTSYLVYPDWVELTYPATAGAAGDRLYIEAVASGTTQVAVSGFTADTVKVFDVRDARHPVQLTTVTAQALLTQAGVEPSGGLSPADAPPAKASTPEVGQAITYTIHFWDANLPNPTYSLSADAGLLAPQAIEPETATTWGAPGNAYDYIAIVHRSLWDAIQPLLDYRAAEGLRVAKVDVQDVYDEFSYGRRDPEAIRSFLSFAYHNWNAGGPRPQYVLLVGDGHYDFTGASSTTLLNLIPPYLVNVDPWLGETAADNRYVSVDGPGDYLPEMHVGRIPAQTAADVTAVVSKTIAYETTAPAGDWQRRVVFVADNCADGAGNFHAISEDIRLNWLPAGYDGQTIYYGSPSSCATANYSTGADMRKAITTTLNSGAFMLQWFGHASRVRWGSVSMFNIFDPPTLNANTVWPMTFAYSCVAGYFMNLDNNWQSLGETLLLTAARGSVADVSPSGFHIGSALTTLDQGMVKAIFQDRIGRAGPAVDAARLYYFSHASGFHDVIDTSIFFGDPALKLRLPPLPVTPTFFPLIEAGKMKLTWTHLPENTGYQVWRSDQPRGQHRRRGRQLRLRRPRCQRPRRLHGDPVERRIRLRARTGAVSCYAEQVVMLSGVNESRSATAGFQRSIYFRYETLRWGHAATYYSPSIRAE
ncbi:MAG: C25 family cysteine peptidase [Chloroflexi bacterium]|nr:C25 family cysteine peptidase [Chloroflexota bacterium]